MKKYGIVWLILCSLVLCGCVGKNGTGKPAESTERESFVIGLDPSESESFVIGSEPSESAGDMEENMGEFAPNSYWEPYTVPLDLAIDIGDDGILQFDGVYHDLHYVLLTFHLIPKQVLQPGSEVKKSEMRRKLYDMAEFKRRRKEESSEEWSDYFLDHAYVEEKVREDGSIGGAFLLETGAFAPLISRTDVVLCFGKNTPDYLLSPTQTYEISLDFDFERIDLSLDEVNLDPALEVEGATLSALSFLIYGRTPPLDIMNEKACSREIEKKLTQKFLVVFNNDEEYKCEGMGYGRHNEEPNRKGKFFVYTHFRRPIDIKNAKGIVYEKGAFLTPVESEKVESEKVESED